MELSPVTRPVDSSGLRRAGLLVASALLVAASAPLIAAPPASPRAAGTGTIKGRLIWAGATIPTPKVDVQKDDPKLSPTDRPVCGGAPIVSKEVTIDPASKGIADGIAYLVSPSGDYSATQKALLEKTPEVVVDQVKCEFVPYVAVVNKDQKLTFKSSDPVGHNVHLTPFSNSAVNQTLPPNGKLAYKIKGAEKRPTKVVCDIHPWMTSYIMIADHPFAVVTQPDGSFEIKDVPAGDQQLVVWHPNPGYVSSGLSKGVTVKVPGGGVVDAGEFKISALKVAK